MSLLLQLMWLYWRDLPRFHPGDLELADKAGIELGVPYFYERSHIGGGKLMAFAAPYCWHVDVSYV
jgi:hypothetical protein